MFSLAMMRKILPRHRRGKIELVLFDGPDETRRESEYLACLVDKRVDEIGSDRAMKFSGEWRVHEASD